MRFSNPNTCSHLIVAACYPNSPGESVQPCCPLQQLLVGSCGLPEHLLQGVTANALLPCIWRPHPISILAIQFNLRPQRRHRLDGGAPGGAAAQHGGPATMQARQGQVKMPMVQTAMQSCESPLGTLAAGPMLPPATGAAVAAAAAEGATVPARLPSQPCSPVLIVQQPGNALRHLGQQLCPRSNA